MRAAQRPGGGGGERASQVEANLPGTSTVIARYLLQMHNKKCLTLKMKVKVKEHNIYNGAILWQISDSIKDIRAYTFLC